ncbi:MAG: hypothetical protein GX597_27190 [Anaerolineaceae bacterium]|jgi:hypothetical protein|nr:hypothetical protein [Anaerolineaceae bacterium]
MDPATHNVVVMLCSASVSQIYKARRYVEEPQRFHPTSEGLVWVEGFNNRHALHRGEDGVWTCDCCHARKYQAYCSHLRAFHELVARDALDWGDLASRQEVERSREEIGVQAVALRPQSGAMRPETG